MARIYKEKSTKKPLISLILILVVAIAIIGCVWYAAGSLKNTHDQESMVTAEKL